MENEERAEIISFDNLSTDIGETKEGSSFSEELQETLEGKKPEDLLDLGTGEEEVEEKEEISTDVEDKEAVVIDEVEELPQTEAAVEEKSTELKTALRAILGEDVESIIQEVDGEEVEVKIDELDLDVETFKAIVDGHQQLQKEQESNNKISVEGISEFTKNLIEIDKNGGDIQSLLKMKEAYTDPLDGLDLSTDQGQKEAIYLRLKAARQNDKDIQRLIKAYEDEGVLGDMAETAEKELRGAFEAQVQKEKERTQEEAKEKAELLKSYKKDLKEKISTSFELKDTVVKKIVDISTKKNENGRYEVDNLINMMKQDPETAAELYLFVLDKDEYKKQVSKKAVESKQLDIAQKIKIAGVKKSSAQVSAKAKTKNDDIIPLFD